jgi:hypothetical protein
MRAKGKIKKYSINLMQPWRENYREIWSIIGVNWSWNTEEPGFQAIRVNSWVSCTETKSGCRWFSDIFSSNSFH